MSRQPLVCVIGGGPAGMIAAGRAAELGAKVVLLERNPALGRKLLITGGGRCNVTNAVADRHLLVARYGARAEALHGVFSRFSPHDMRELLGGLGLDTVKDAEGRVFPVTQKATSVRDALVAYLGAGSVEVRTTRAFAGSSSSSPATRRPLGRASPRLSSQTAPESQPTGSSWRPAASPRPGRD